MTDEEAKARARFFTISALQIGGAMMVLLGILIAAGRLAAPPVAGYALIVVGLVDFAIVPRLLARRWRTPPER